LMRIQDQIIYPKPLYNRLRLRFKFNQFRELFKDNENFDRNVKILKENDEPFDLIIAYNIISLFCFSKAVTIILQKLFVMYLFLRFRYFDIFTVMKYRLKSIFLNNVSGL